MRRGLPTVPIFTGLLLTLRRVFGQLTLPEPQRQRLFQARLSIPAAEENFVRHKIWFQIPSPGLSFQGYIGDCFDLLVRYFKTLFPCFGKYGFFPVLCAVGPFFRCVPRIPVASSSDSFLNTVFHAPKPLSRSKPRKGYFPSLIPHPTLPRNGSSRPLSPNCRVSRL